MSLINEDEEQQVQELEQEQSIYDLDLVIKLYLKANKSNFEIYYPNYRQNPIYLKNIVYKLKQVNEFEQGSLCTQLLGIYPDIAFDLQAKKNRIIIKGFQPKQFTYKHKYQLKIGDLIVSINNIEIDADNIEGLLYVLNKTESIVLTTISSLNYQLLARTEPLATTLTTAYNGIKTVANSKSTQVVQGDRINNNNTNDLNQDDCNYLIMVLAFDSQNNTIKDSNEMRDIVYKYPRSNENNANETQLSNNRKLTNMNELIKSIRGLFVTLSLTIKDIDCNDEALLCMLEHQDQLYHVCFLHGNYSRNGILILIIPMEQISLNYLKILAKNLNNTFRFTFGSLFNKLIDDKLQYRLNEHEKNAINAEFDTFFSQLKQRFYLNNTNNNNNNNQVSYSNLLNTSSTNNQGLGTAAATPLLAQQQQILMQRQQDNLRRTNLLIEMRYKCFVDSMPPYLEVPVELKHDVDSILNGLEAQEFVDLENDFYLNRRLFSLIGTCLFYKDYLITTHLNRSRTSDVFNYCEHYGFFNLIRNGCINQTVVWKEVHLSDLMNNGKQTNRKVESRHFLVLIALKEFLITVILENGGMIARHIDTNQLIEPNPFYIQQITYAMNDLYESGLMSDINRYYNFNCGNKQIVFNINKFLKLKLTKEKQQHLIKQRERSNSRSPTRLASARNKSNDSKKEDKTIVSTSSNHLNQVENVKISDLEINNQFVYQSNKEYRHKSPAVSASNRLFTDKEYIRYFNDISLNDSIIYYASNTNNTNGILFSPKKYDFNSNLFLSVFSNYIQTCFKIKNLFDKTTSTGTNNNQTFIEQGVLFNVSLADDKLEQLNNSKSFSNHNSCSNSCTSNKIKELNFWVVGRRRFKQVKSKWISLGDFFICFHDSSDQILIELAFDLGMFKMAI